MKRQIRRRRFLGSLGALTAAGVLAGCTTETRREQTADGDGDGDGGDGGTDGTDGGSPDVEWPSYLDDAEEDTFADRRGEDEVTVAVENLYFDPTKLLVDAGTTITWEFNTPTHNVKPNSQPGEDLEGTEGDENEPVAQGETYSATLEETGTYTYFCGPHEASGMKGGIQVE